MTRKYLIVSVLFLSFFQISCLKNSIAECSYSPCKFVAPSTEITAVSNYLSANSLTATQHCSGVFYTITTAGTGKQANACSGVNVKYTGKLTNGNTFDQQVVNPVGIDLNNVVNGWRIGIPLIKEGGTMTLYIPPYMGYGAQDIKDANGNVLIPANSIIIFTIELTAVL
jgi:FKBP-type peptidyl-prolyl cis-trans isomerase FkpA